MISNGNINKSVVPSKSLAELALKRDGRVDSLKFNVLKKKNTRSKKELENIGKVDMDPVPEREGPGKKRMNFHSESPQSRKKFLQNVFVPDPMHVRSKEIPVSQFNFE